MHLGRTRSVGLVGIRGMLVDVEVDITPGLPKIVFSGTVDPAVREAGERVRSATAYSGVPFPPRRVTINLSPASVPKSGSGFDLAIAVAVLAAARAVPAALVDGVVHLGELALDGTVRGIRGVLPLVLGARAAGFPTVVVPWANVPEARLVSGIEVVGVRDLGGLITRYHDLDQGRCPVELADPPAAEATQSVVPPDLAEVVGQDDARHALAMAAAGGHHLALVGPPGAGKTMLAERLPGLLPRLTEEQALEVATVASVLGVLPAGGRVLSHQAPFVAPHHGASMAAMVGGGSGTARPGAVSLSHHGVLFLDEAPEFAAAVLQALRQPMEAGEVTVARANGAFRFPARFQLVIAANPCPCGHGSGKGLRCTCRPHERRRYLTRLGGPLVDRLDIQVYVDRPTRAQLTGPPGEPTEVVAARVREARAIQGERLAPWGWSLNRDVPGSVLRTGPLALPRARTAVLDQALDRGRLSLRGYDRCLRMAWTLRDLDGGGTPTADDIASALTLRCSTEEAA